MPTSLRSKGKTVVDRQSPDDRLLSLRYLHSRRGLRRFACLAGVCLAAWMGSSDLRPASGQALHLRYGDPVPSEVKSIFENGLNYLAKQQQADGTWGGSQYGAGPGVDGLCCLAFLSCGEDPNFGRYSETLRKAIRSIVRRQDAETGLLSDQPGAHGSMYHHGFATLALAEAYGAMDDELLWEGTDTEGRRPLGQALERAVARIITSQDLNPHGGWRYTPDAKDADVSVSGANLVALLAAKNAGIEVPDKNIERAMEMLERATDASGAVAYQIGDVGFAFGDSLARSSIACLSLSIAKRKESEAFQATLKYLVDRADRPAGGSWPEYSRYYMAQALFQGNFEAWSKWNQVTIEQLQQEQQEDGAIGQGATYSTAMGLLSLALNYRFLPIYER